MPTSTFSIAASADDQFVSETSVGYPPSSAITRDSTNAEVYPSRGTGGGQFAILNALLQWDTSALPDNAILTNAVLRMYATILSGNADARSIVAGWYRWDGVSAADWTSLAETDAHNGTPIGGITISATNDFTLANLQNIGLAGRTYLRLHVSGGQPTGINEVRFASFNNVSGFAVPQLIVTYNTPGADTPSAPAPQVGRSSQRFVS